MSRRYLTPIDMGKLEILNLRFQNLASAPGSPVEGQVYYDTTDHALYIYNANTTTWDTAKAPTLTNTMTTDTTQSVSGQKTFTGGVIINTVGLTGNKEINLTGTGASSVAGTFSGTALSAAGLTGATSASRYVGATATAAPASGTFVVGDFIIARDGVIWICTSAGSPGTWVSVGSAPANMVTTDTTQSISGQKTLTGGLIVNTVGITGNKEVNLTGTGASSVAGTFSATAHATTGLTGAVTATRYAGGTASAAPGSGTFVTGDYIVAANGRIFICTAGGTPGTWVDAAVVADGSITGGTAGAGVKIAATTITAANIASATITDTQIAAANKSGSAGVESLRQIGTGALNAMAGNTTLSSIAAPTGSVSLNSQKITNLLTPTTGTDAANKDYVDNVAAGLDFKGSVRVATTATGTLATAFENGDTIDGVALVTGNRILLKNQGTASENGIYVVAASGAPTRATDSDASGELSPGALTYVEEGTVNAGTQWVVSTTTATPWVPGSSGSTWTQFSGASDATAGAGLTRTGNIYAVGQGTGITVAADTVGIDTSLVARKAVFGLTGGATSEVVTHNLGTRDVVVSVLNNGTPWEEVEVDVEATSTNTVTLRSAANLPASYRVIVVG